MEVITKVDEFLKLRSKYNFSTRVGFVPTMGALHEGHLSLIDEMVGECDFRVVSIFVNPMQFDERADFDKYPRDLDQDLKILRSKNIDAVFVPEVDEIYPFGKNGFEFVLPDRFKGKMCASSREGHFEGVCSVIVKLFNIVRPNFVYFGQKDYLQAKIVESLIEDMFLNCVINVLPTVRDKNDVALSSRNSLLSDDEMKDAEALIRCLNFVDRLIRNGETDTEGLLKLSRDFLKSFEKFELEYLEFYDAVGLRRLENVMDAQARLIAIAGRIGKVRLIDNKIL